jgi:hypothetical protein
MEDKDKIFDAFRNCITEPKCKDCPWESCEEFHQTKKIPLDLCLDILKLMKEQEEEIENLKQAAQSMIEDIDSLLGL